MCIDIIVGDEGAFGGDERSEETSLDLFSLKLFSLLKNSSL